MSEQEKINEQSKDQQLETFRRDTGENLTTNQGVRVDDTDNSLTAGARGPTLMEDFHVLFCKLSSNTFGRVGITGQR